jgi:hypothetical protein
VPEYAANDFAIIFTEAQFGCTDYQSKYSFCKSYLHHSDLPCQKSDVEGLIFDAEFQRLRCGYSSILYRDLTFTMKYPNWNFKLYKTWEDFEKIARNEKQVFDAVAKLGVFGAASEFYGKISVVEDQKVKVLREPMVIEQIKS